MALTSSRGKSVTIAKRLQVEKEQLQAASTDDTVMGGSDSVKVASNGFSEISETSERGICQLISKLDGKRPFVVLEVREIETRASLSEKSEALPCDQVRKVLPLKDFLGPAKTNCGITLQEKNRKEMHLL